MDRREAIDGLEKVLANRGDAESATTTDCISRQAAIEAIEERFFAGTVADINPSWRLLHEIIESLPPVEPVAKTATPTEDCISRQAVTDLLLDAQDGSGQTYEVIRELLHEVAYMPSVSEEEVDYCNNCPYISWGEDCISRQQAIEAIEDVEWYRVNSKGELVSGSTSDEESWYRAEDVYRAIESLPPVTPTERTGEWIENAPEGQGIDPPYICSICGHAESTKTPFCEQCGADMRGEEE